MFTKFPQKSDSEIILTLLYILLPCVSRPAWRMLVLLIARYVSNLINEHYYYYYYYL